MPQRQPKTPAWLRDPQLRAEFLAVLGNLDTTQPLPETVDRAESAGYPLAQRVLEIDAHEEALDESTWSELDAAGFPWRTPRAPRLFAPPPKTSAVQKPGRTAQARAHDALRDIAEGTASYSDVFNLRATFGMKSDPVQVWLERGFRFMRANQLSLLEVCAHPTRTVLRSESSFAVGAWLQQVRAAASDAHISNIAAMLQQHLSRSDYVTLRNIGIIERYYANQPVVPLPTNHCVTLADGNEVRVGRWIHHCRSIIREGTAPPYLAEALEHAGVVLDPRPGLREWTLGVHALKQFHRREGHWRPTAKHVEVLPDGSRVALRRFISETLRDYATDALPPQYLNQLAAIGFNPSEGLILLDRHFAERLNDLDAFIAERNTTELSATDVYTRPDGTRIDIGRWMMHIRAMARAGTLSEARQEALLSRNVRAIPLRRERHLEVALVALDSFIAREGHAYVPGRWKETLPDGSTHPLGHWITEKRSHYRRGRLSNTYVQLLTSRGVDLETYVDRVQSWNTYLRALEQFRAREGHVDVVRTHSEVLPNGSQIELGIWLRRQRELLKAGTLRPERFATLDALGVTWDPNASQFNTGFALLKRFQSEHGHVDVPQRHVVRGPDGEPFPLGVWIAIRRRSMRRGTLAPEQDIALRSIGVDPANRYDRHLDAGFAAFRTYVQQHGHGAVHSSFTITLDDGNEFPLGKWVIHMRRMRNRNRLATETIAALDAAGFVWDDARGRFEWNLAAYDRYLATGGRGRPPKGHSDVLPDGTPANLRTWYDTQHRRARIGTLPDDQRAALIARGVFSQVPTPQPTQRPSTPPTDLGRL